LSRCPPYPSISISIFISIYIYISSIYM